MEINEVTYAKEVKDLINKITDTISSHFKTTEFTREESAVIFGALLNMKEFIGKCVPSLEHAEAMFYLNRIDQEISNMKVADLPKEDMN